MRCKLLTFALTIIIIAAFTQTSVVCGEEPETLKLTVYPQAFPQPALKYQLLPEFKDRIRGNAAVYYGKVTAEHMGFFGNMQLRDKIDEWRAAPLAELLKPDVDLPSDAIENMLRLAARCESCDWQLPIREGPFYTMGLPEVQQLRQFARILGARFRIQMSHGDFDAAIKTMQTGLAIGHNAAEGETLINALVGIAIDGIMSSQLFDLAQQPKAPNLYWALTSLPRPLIDMRKGAEAEMAAFALTFPETTNLRAKRTPEEWEETLSSFWRKVFDMVPFLGQGPDEPQWKKGMTVQSLIAESYAHVPAGRQRLLDEGVAPDVVSAMPNAQVALIEAVASYEIERDKLFRWFLVPYHEGLEPGESPMHEAELEFKKRESQGKLSQIFLMDLYPARRAAAKIDRDIAVLRAIEMLRMYAASHNLELPTRLSDVTGAPVPIDAMTGKPIEYELKEDIGVIKVTPLTGRTRTYEIRVAKP
jgi:hypothetical protein